MSVYLSACLVLPKASIEKARVLTITTFLYMLLYCKHAAAFSFSLGQVQPLGQLVACCIGGCTYCIQLGWATYVCYGPDIARARIIARLLSV